MPRQDVALEAPAKINLALHVTGRRDDGYHLLDSIAVFADAGDAISIRSAETLKLTVAGPFAAHAPGDATDLAYRAAQAFFAEAKLAAAAAIRVEKNLPAGAGLGGGSSDAAAVLKGLALHSGVALSAEALQRTALKLGADVPMCLVGRALRARGIGEAIDAVEGWPPLPLVLVWPGRAVSTAEVFKTLARRDNPPLTEAPSARSPREVADWLAGCRNDLEPPALALCPEIGEALTALRASEGCLLQRMSGSGSACFALYAEIAEAHAAAAKIAAARPGWWVRATTAR